MINRLRSARIVNVSGLMGSTPASRRVFIMLFRLFSGMNMMMKAVQVF
jgi:hypothetical protein